MLSLSNLEEIKNITREFFRKITFSVEISFEPQKDLTLPIIIKTDEPQILIGERGQTLADVQHLLKAMLKKKIQADFYIDLDINGYKEKKMEYIKEMARLTADEVSSTRGEKSLPPMPAYERRVVHMELEERSDIATESIGREPERKVVIKPHP